MNFTYLKYIAIATAAVLIVALTADRYSSFRQSRLEGTVERTKAEAAETQRRSEELATDAATYREKIEYLEKQIADIGQIARKQDEELKTHSRRSDAARGDLDRVRATRPIDVTTRELCEKLAELGHKCG